MRMGIGTVCVVGSTANCLIAEGGRKQHKTQDKKKREANVQFWTWNEIEKFCDLRIGT